MTMKCAILGALSFFSLHIRLVISRVLLSGATGETQGWLTYFADLAACHRRRCRLDFWMAVGPSYVILVCVLGPLMYAAIEH